MKKNSHSFVRFLNLFRALNSGVADPSGAIGIHQEAVAILAFIYAENERASYPTITKIVQKIEFGAPPTIQRRLKELQGLRFIEFCGGVDKRHKLIRVTEEGNDYLGLCSKLLEDALSPCVKNCAC